MKACSLAMKMGDLKVGLKVVLRVYALAVKMENLMVVMTESKWVA